MLWHSLLLLTSSIIQFFLNLLPDADPNITSQITVFLTDFKGLFEFVNFFFPVSTFFGMLLAIFQIETAVLGWHIAKLAVSIMSLGWLKL